MKNQQFVKDIAEAAFQTYRKKVMWWMSVSALSEAAEKHIILGWNRGYSARRTSNEILTTADLLGKQE